MALGHKLHCAFLFSFCNLKCFQTSEWAPFGRELAASELFPLAQTSWKPINDNKGSLFAHARCLTNLTKNNSQLHAFYHRTAVKLLTERLESVLRAAEEVADLEDDKVPADEHVVEIVRVDLD